MNYTMTFPDTWEEYERLYGFTDDAELYTNGCRLIPSFRVEQWLQHIAERTDVLEIKVGKWIDTKDGGVCSMCKNGLKIYKKIRPLISFCPFCGTRMERSEE